MTDDSPPPEPAAPSPRRRRSDSGGSGRSRRSGRRAQRRREERRRRLLRGGIIGFVVVALALAGFWAVTTFDLFASDPSDAPTTDPTAAPTEVVDPQSAWVFVTFDEAGTGAADLITILSHDVATGDATILLVPSHLLAEIPGRGLSRLDDAFRSDGAPLLEIALANVLGIDFDHSIAVSRQSWSALFTRIGGLTMDVPDQVRGESADGSTQVRFQPGEQFLDGPRVAEYLTLAQPGETQLQQFPRVQQVFESLLTALAEDDSLLAVLFEDGAPMLDTAATAELQDLLTRMSTSAAAGQLQVRSLPVEALGAGSDLSYRVDEDRVADLVADLFAGSVPDASVGGRRVQVLNGNGLPGIGQQVAELLQPGGFRIVDSGNHANFDEPVTRILVFDDDPDQVAAAQEAAALLGVGTVSLSEVPLGVADIVVIVGADFTG